MAKTKITRSPFTSKLSIKVTNSYFTFEMPCGSICVSSYSSDLVPVGYGITANELKALRKYIDPFNHRSYDHMLARTQSLLDPKVLALFVKKWDVAPTLFYDMVGRRIKVGDVVATKAVSYSTHTRRGKRNRWMKVLGYAKQSIRCCEWDTKSKTWDEGTAVSIMSANCVKL